MPPVARRMLAATLLLLLGSAVGLVRGSAPGIQVPADDEDAAYRKAVVRRSLEGNCLICHTET